MVSRLGFGGGLQRPLDSKWLEQKQIVGRLARDFVSWLTFLLCMC